MGLQRKAGRHLYRRPELVSFAGNFGVGRAYDDVSRIGILLKHKIEYRIQFFRRNFPGDECTRGEVGGEQGLADAPDRSCFEHIANAAQDRFEGQVCLTGNFGKWIADKTGYLVLRNGENPGIHRIRMLNGDHGESNALHRRRRKGFARPIRARPLTAGACIGHFTSLMVEKIQTLLTLLGIVSVLAVVAERVKFPFPILLVVAGLLIAMCPRLPEVKLDPELVFLIFLPPLLFSAAWNFPWENFRSNFLPIFALAVGLVFATIVCVAYAANWLIPGMTLAAGFVLGAIVSPPDAVAAIAVLKNLHIPKRLSAVLEGESLVNDASGLVAYQFAVAGVVTGSFSLMDAGADFVWMSVGGSLFGLLVGMGVAYLHRRLRDPSVAVTLTLLTPYISYLPAERFGFSGVLAVVATGLHIGHRSWEALGPESRIQRESIWRLLDYVLNGVIFILIGLQFPSIIREMRIPISQMIFIGTAISLVVIAVRFLWVFPLVYLERHFFRRGGTNHLSLGGLVVASWAGMRGVVSLATALALPLTISTGEAFPHRHIILFLTFCVIFVTLVLQGLTLPWLVRKMKVQETDSDFRSEGQARITILEELICEIDGLAAREETQEYRESLERWSMHYQERLRNLQGRLTLAPEMNLYAANKDRDLLPKLMNQARRHLARMRRQGDISEDVRRRIEQDFDMEEQRIKRLLSRMGR
jgi:monovalent cation/hydrogen antiporter